MGIIDAAEEAFDDFLDAASHPVDTAFGFAAAGRQFFAKVSEDVFAEAGGHAYVDGANDILKANGEGRPLLEVDPGMAGALREAFGALTDDISITFEAELVELKIKAQRFGHPAGGQTFGHLVYIKRPWVRPDHPDYPDLLRLVAHELVHARQFDEAGKSLLLFGNRYFRQYFRAQFVYERNIMEREADAFADCFMRRRQRLASVEQLHRENWSHGWTHFVPFALGGKPHYLAYKSGAGTAALDQVKPDARGVKEIWREQWTAGWTSFVLYSGVHLARPVNAPPMPLPTRHLLAYKAATGEVAIDRLDGTKLVPGLRSKWTPGWTHMFGFTALQSRTFLFSYKAGNGDAAIDELRADGSGETTLFRSAPGQFSTEWTAFAPFEFEGQPHYLAYKALKGEFVLHRFVAGVNGVDGINGIEERLRSKLFITGASALMPFQLAGLPHFLLYRSGSGAVAILRVANNKDDRGNPVRGTIGLEVVWCHRWSKGWTSFMPFELEGRPHYLAYKRETGEAAFDRLAGGFPPLPARLNAANAPRFARFVDLAARATASMRLGEFLRGTAAAGTYTDGGCFAPGAGQATLVLAPPAGNVSGTVTYAAFDRCYGMRLNGTASVTGTLQAGNRVALMSFAFRNLACAVGGETLQLSGTAALHWTSVLPESRYGMTMNADSSAGDPFRLDDFRVDARIVAGVETVLLSGRLATVDGFVDIAARGGPLEANPANGLRNGEITLTGATTFAIVRFRGRAAPDITIALR